MLETLDDLFLVHVESMYDAELRLTAALPALAEAAGCDRLRAVLQHHLHGAMNHVHMLESVLVGIGSDSHRKTCEPIQHLLSQAEEVLRTPGGPEFKNAALVSVARRVHHYKIAAYSSLRVLTQRSGRREFVEPLDRAVEAETESDRRLATIAEFSFDRAIGRLSA